MIMALVWLWCQHRTTAQDFSMGEISGVPIVLWCILYLDATVQNGFNTPAYSIAFQASLIKRVMQKYLIKRESFCQVCF